MIKMAQCRKTGVGPVIDFIIAKLDKTGDKTPYQRGNHQQHDQGNMDSFIRRHGNSNFGIRCFLRFCPFQEEQGGRQRDKASQP